MRAISRRPWLFNWKKIIKHSGCKNTWAVINAWENKGEFPLVKKLFFILAIVSYPLFTAANEMSRSEALSLTLAATPDGTHAYYHELISGSMKEAGQEVKVRVKKAMPQRRILMLLADGELTLHWMVQTDDRDKKYLPVRVGLTNGLIGHRVLFIPKGSQSVYDAVETLDDFRNLGKIGGFGKNWFDVKVWRHNRLRYFEQDGEWRTLYKKLPLGRDVDYFSRGANEIVVESYLHPDLDVEKNLVLVYDRDFRFYLKPGADKIRDMIENAVQKARESGLMDKLIRKHFKEVFEKLNLDNRKRILLDLPSTGN